jgi:hypothetical protein
MGCSELIRTICPPPLLLVMAVLESKPFQQVIHAFFCGDSRRYPPSTDDMVLDMCFFHCLGIFVLLTKLFVLEL